MPRFLLWLALAWPSFRAQAEALAAQWHPATNVNAEDTAVHFLTRLQAARLQDARQAALTYCMYEDGTPAQWQTGAGDCFSRHESFSERLARQQACEGLQPPPDPLRGLAATYFCKSAP
jgi:hypothetical protein